MQKINFENLPSTNTPLSAENLNLMQDNIEDAIDEINGKIGALNIESTNIGTEAYSKTLADGGYLVVVNRRNGETTAGLYIANISTASFLTTIAEYSRGTLVLSNKAISITPSVATQITIIKLY